MGAMSGFAVVGFAVLVGYITARVGILPENARPVLSKLAFYVCSPLLLFTILGTADVATLFTDLLPVSVIAAAAVFVLFIVFAKLTRNNTGTAIIGALGSGYVNANNIGIPIATFMLGGAVFSAPVILLQLIFWAPIALLSLGAWTAGSTKIHQIVLRTLKNPIIIGSMLGLLIAVFRIELPAVVWEATGMVGHASIPLLLIAFGMSMHGTKLLQAQSERVNIVVASVLKLAVMPLIAWAVATFVFGLDAQAVYAVTILAALPTAQNVLNYANEYGTSQLLARDVTFITTAGAIPVLFIITLLLA